MQSWSLKASMWSVHKIVLITVALPLYLPDHHPIKEIWNIGVKNSKLESCPNYNYSAQITITVPKYLSNSQYISTILNIWGVQLWLFGVFLEYWDFISITKGMNKLTKALEVCHLFSSFGVCLHILAALFKRVNCVR